MNDPWKFLAFPVSAVVSYFLALALEAQVSSVTGLPEFQAKLAVLSASGLAIGFLVDEVIPTYLKDVRSGGGAGGMAGGDDFDSGDFDLE